MWYTPCLYIWKGWINVVYRSWTVKHNKHNWVWPIHYPRALIFVMLSVKDGFMRFIHLYDQGLCLWASYQIRKIATCACAGNAGNVSPCGPLQRKSLVSDPGMHHGTCVTHVPWCMSGSLTRCGRENVPGIPGACAPAILRIWQEAHGTAAIIRFLRCQGSNQTTAEPSRYSISQEICTRFCCALLCCGYAIVHNEFTWSIYPYSSGLLCWHWGNR